MSDNITLPREVVKFVLQHLEWWSDDEPQEKEAIEALRTALAAPRLEVTVDPRLTAEEAAAISSAIDARKKEQSEDIEALRRDAERFRWLKAKVEDYDGHACFPEVSYPAPIPDRSPFDAIDAAIDAAMKEGT